MHPWSVLDTRHTHRRKSTLVLEMRNGTTVIKIRNKVKKIVAECKKASLIMRTASGVKRFTEERNYGAWFTQLSALVKTTESCQPEQAIVPGEQSLGSSSDCEDNLN